MDVTPGQVLLAVALVAGCSGAARERRATLDEPRPAPVPITTMERRLIAGVREPRLTDDEKRDFLARHYTNPVVMVKLCLHPDGTPSSLVLIKGSSNAAANETVLAAVREWRFSPTVVDGKPVPVCTAIMFRYHIHERPSEPAFAP